jgi:phosphoribosylformimino-5-aminoimidazole carboxamide ribonucleotide (ProFAR) isomerase
LRDPRRFDIGLSILDSIFLLHRVRKEVIEQIQICDAEFCGTNSRRQSTSRCLVAADGIRMQGEIDMLDALGVDAVVGMALYSGRISG